MSLVPPKMDNLLNFKGKFIPHSLFFNAISKRIKLESWDWSQIEGDLSLIKYVTISDYIRAFNMHNCSGFHSQ